MAQQTTPTPSYTASSAKTAKTRFLDAYERELATTHKVLRALPGDKSDFRPHERSNTAFALAWTFVVEGKLLLKGLRHEEVLGGGFGTAPASWDAVRGSACLPRPAAGRSSRMHIPPRRGR